MKSINSIKTPSKQQSKEKISSYKENNFINSTPNSISSKRLDELKSQKEKIITNQRIYQMEILNKNMKRKLQLFENKFQLSVKSPLTNRKFSSKSQIAPKRQQGIKQQTKKLNKENNRQSFSKKQGESKRSIVYSPMQSSNEKKQKYTKYQKKIIHQVRNFNQFEDNKFSKYQNPFQLALLEMIDKQQEMLKKRQTDLQFWRERVTNLQLKYSQLNVPEK